MIKLLQITVRTKTNLQQYYVSPPLWWETYLCVLSVRPSVCPSHSLSAQLLCNYWTEFHEIWQIVRTPYLVVHIPRKLWSPDFCGSYAPLKLEISRNILLKQLVITTSLKLLNRISWHLVGSKGIICSCAYYQEILISWILWELCPFELK